MYIPSQKKIYKELFRKSIENIHNAQYDICATIKILYWFYENKEKYINKIENKKKIKHDNIKEIKHDNIKENVKENYGVKWTDDEYTILLNEIKENKNIDDICKNHKRTHGWIKGGIRRLLERINDKDVINYYEKNQNVIIIEKDDREEDKSDNKFYPDI